MRKRATLRKRLLSSLLAALLLVSSSAYAADGAAADEDDFGGIYITQDSEAETFPEIESGEPEDREPEEYLEETDTGAPEPQDSETQAEYDLPEDDVLTHQAVQQSLALPDMEEVPEEDEGIIRVQSSAGLAQAVKDAQKDGTLYRIYITESFQQEGNLEISNHQNILLQSDPESGTVYRLEMPGNRIRVADGGKLSLVDIILDGCAEQVADAEPLSVIYSTGDVVIGENAVIENAAVTGAPIYAVGGNIVLDGGEVRGNRKVGSAVGAGGILMEGGTLTLNSGKVTGNTAVLGGGILINKGNFIMHGGEVSGNHASSSGGGIAAQNMYADNTFTIAGGEIIGNTASVSGGVYLTAFTNPQPIDIIGVRFAENEAGSGGGIYTGQNNLVLNLEETVFEENTARKLGGGIMQSGSSSEMHILNCVFQSNRAENSEDSQDYVYGGAVYHYGSNTITTISGEDTVFSGNGAVSGFGAHVARGGGVYTAGSSEAAKATLTITDGIYADNYVSADASTSTYGGMAFVMYTDFEMTGGKISGNTSARHAGAIGAGNASLVISGGNISGNSAFDAGGAVYLSASQLTVSDGTVISGNTAQRGGAVTVAGAAAMLTLKENTQIIYNRATSDLDADGNRIYGGGGIYLNQATAKDNIVSDDSTNFSGNSALVAFALPAQEYADYPNIAFAGTSIDNHPLNNFDIFYVSEDENIIPTFTVTYKANGGQGADYSHFAGKNYTLIGAEQAGFTHEREFLGWSTSAGQNNQVTHAPNQMIELDSDSIFHAVWKAPAYTVTYNGNGNTGGTVPVDGTAYESGALVTVLGNTGALTKTDYTFAGWSENAAAETAQYTANASFAITKDTTLYAVWQKNSTDGGGGSGGGTTYTVTFLLNDGSEGADNVYLTRTVSKGRTVAQPDAPERTGYVFTGWYTDAQSTALYDFSSPVNANLTLYAGWETETSLPFSDSHYAYLIGYQDGTVRPQSSITRAEAATIFFRLIEDSYREEIWRTANAYPDVGSSAWYNNAVSTMTAGEVLTGYPDGSFRPDDYITRAEFAAIVARFTKGSYSGENQFSDISGHWAAELINIAASLGWVEGDGDGTFRPDSLITRAETAMLINRVLNRLPETEDDLLEDMTVWPDNMDTGAWYYLAIQEATNSHYHESKNAVYETWTALRENRNWALLERSGASPGDIY